MVHPVFNTQLEFLPCMKYFCTKSCMLQLLTYFQVPQALLYINTGFKLEIVFSCSGYYVDSTDALYPSASKNILSQGFDESFEKVFNFNKQQLLFGNPPILLADTYHLPYRREYQKIHASHSVILAGFDKDSVSLIDFYPPHYFKGYIDMAAFSNSRTSMNPKDKNPFSGYPILNYWYQLKTDNLNNMLNECVTNNLFDVTKKTSDPQKGLRREEALMFLYAYFTKYKHAGMSEKNLLMAKLHESLYVYQNASSLMVIYMQKLKEKLQIPEKILHSLQELNKCLVQFTVSCIRGSVSKNPSSYDNLEVEFRQLIEKQADYLSHMDEWKSEYDFY